MKAAILSIILFAAASCVVKEEGYHHHHDRVVVEEPIAPVVEVEAPRHRHHEYVEEKIEVR